MTPRAWLWLLLLAAIWGSSYLFISVALESVGPAFLVLVRTGGAAAILAPVLWRRRAALVGRWHLVPLVAAFQVAIPLLLISAGERYLDSGLTGILIATQPVWLVLLAPMLRQGKPTALSVAGIGVGLSGVGVLLGGPGAGTPGQLGGAALIVGAAAAYAVGVVLVRRLMPGVDPIAVTAANMVASTIAYAPLAGFDLPTAMPSLAAVGSLVVLAVVCTAAGFVIYNRLIASVGGQRASLVAYLAPPFAVGYGALILDEPVGVNSLVGLLLVLLGSWVCARYARAVPAGRPVRDSRVPVG